MTARIPGATNVAASSLTSDMIVALGTTGPKVAQTTLSALGQYFTSVSGGNAVNTAISTAGAGTLTAAGLLGGLITRTGPVAAYTDTTATAAQLNTAQGANTPAGTSLFVYIKNTVAFASTLAAGSGVTLSGQTIIPPNSVGQFLLTRTSATAYTLRGVDVAPLTTSVLMASASIVTIGAGTLTAAGIAGGLVNRTGSTAAYTDTTDTADLIIAARPNANIGESWQFTYYNNTLGAGTITGGSGVTPSLVTIVPANMWARYLVTYTAASTITMVGMEMGPCVALPASKYTTGTAATFAAGDITGANFVNYTNTGNNASLTVRTAAQMFADIPNCQIGFNYQLAIRNTNATGATVTADGGATVTLTGTMSIAQNVTRLFNVVFPSATTCTITSMGISAAAA